VPPAPPADVPPAPPADVPPAPPADVPPPAGDLNTATPAQPQNAGYTRQLWQAIRGADVHGNDALDALAQPSANN
jgi:hypothetical protein